MGARYREPPIGMLTKEPLGLFCHCSLGFCVAGVPEFVSPMAAGGDCGAQDCAAASFLWCPVHCILLQKHRGRLLSSSV